MPNPPPKKVPPPPPQSPADRARATPPGREPEPASAIRRSMTDGLDAMPTALQDVSPTGAGGRIPNDSPLRRSLTEGLDAMPTSPLDVPPLEAADSRAATPTDGLDAMATSPHDTSEARARPVPKDAAIRKSLTEGFDAMETSPQDVPNAAPAAGARQDPRRSLTEGFDAMATSPQEISEADLKKGSAPKAPAVPRDLLASVQKPKPRGVVEEEATSPLLPPQAMEYLRKAGLKPPSSRPPAELPSMGTYGKYDLLGRLAFGGMAEIYLARERGPEGAERYIVIKRILPHVADDESFTTMFLDEARLAMRLQHPNICHIYEFGKQDGTYFIAMEWVNGVSLGKLIRRARIDGGIPVPIAAKVIAQVAEALHYAHRARDEKGRRLNIVHRDVSPQNIMISYDGVVKLLDFGIAKAASHSVSTQAGVIKGKFAYMSPQQCLGEAIDGRADIFALGTCLYESITGKPLFHRNTEYETMKAVIEEPVPMIQRERADVPDGIDFVIQRALAKQTVQRFQTAGEMQTAIEEALAEARSLVNATKISEYLEGLFAEEIRRGPMVDSTPFAASFKKVKPSAQESDPKVIVPEGVGATRLEEAEIPVEIEASESLRPGAKSLRPGESLKPPAEKRFALPKADPAPAAPLPPSTGPRQRNIKTFEMRRAPGAGPSKLTLLGIAMILVAATIVATVFLMRRAAPPPPSTAPAPSAANATLPVTPSATPPPAPQPPPPVEPQPAAANTGSARIISSPEGAIVSIDGRPIGSTPAEVPDLAPGNHEVEIALEGYNTFRSTLAVEAGARAELAAELERRRAPTPAAPLGTLSLNTRPWSKVFVGSRQIGTTPFTERVPSGNLQLRLVDRDGNTHRRSVTVPPNGTARQFFDLTQPE